jgi:hypothetical protein
METEVLMLDQGDLFLVSASAGHLLERDCLMFDGLCICCHISRIILLVSGLYPRGSSEIVHIRCWRLVIWREHRHFLNLGWMWGLCSEMISKKGGGTRSIAWYSVLRIMCYVLHSGIKAGERLMDKVMKDIVPKFSSTSTKYDTAV